jgi:hypothetical protein
MNCFNIRELQSVLKNKFFTDLVNSHDHKDLLSQSMIGLRFRQNFNSNLDLDMSSFYKYGIHKTNVNKFYTIFLGDSSTKRTNQNSLSNYEAYFLGTFDYRNIFTLKRYSYNLEILMSEVSNTFSAFSIFSLSLFSKVFNVLSFKSLSLVFKSLLTNFSFIKETLLFINVGNNSSILNINNTDALNINNRKNIEILNVYSEASNNQRINRFNNIFINYDYKTGNYLGKWESYYPFLMNSIVEVAKGIRKPS